MGFRKAMSKGKIRWNSVKVSIKVKPSKEEKQWIRDARKEMWSGLVKSIGEYLRSSQDEHGTISGDDSKEKKPCCFVCKCERKMLEDWGDLESSEDHCFVCGCIDHGTISVDEEKKHSVI